MKRCLLITLLYVLSYLQLHHKASPQWQKQGSLLSFLYYFKSSNSSDTPEIKANKDNKDLQLQGVWVLGLRRNSSPASAVSGRRRSRGQRKLFIEPRWNREGHLCIGVPYGTQYILTIHTSSICLALTLTHPPSLTPTLKIKFSGRALIVSSFWALEKVKWKQWESEIMSGRHGGTPGRREKLPCTVFTRLDKHYRNAGC